MPISALVNGRSVAQVRQDGVEYWHVELDAHEILLAEGTPAESCLDFEADPDFAPLEHVHSRAYFGRKQRYARTRALRRSLAD